MIEIDGETNTHWDLIVRTDISFLLLYKIMKIAIKVLSPLKLSLHYLMPPGSTFIFSHGIPSDILRVSYHTILVKWSKFRNLDLKFIDRPICTGPL